MRVQMRKTNCPGNSICPKALCISQRIHSYTFYFILCDLNQDVSASYTYGKPHILW